jgi:CheY-like chemotaxis protein
VTGLSRDSDGCLAGQMPDALSFSAGCFTSYRWHQLTEKQEETVMKKDGKPITILVADDDPDDRILVQDALTESRLANDVRFVEDGEELMDYLLHRHKYADAASAPSPGLILLDLNMPRKDGREAIREIKADAQLKFIPIVVLTTSRAEEDIYKTYNLGVNSFITKPVTFESFVELMRLLGRYWFEIVELPRENSNEKYGMLYREGTAR